MLKKNPFPPSTWLRVHLVGIVATGFCLLVLAATVPVFAQTSNPLTDGPNVNGPGGLTDTGGDAAGDPLPTDTGGSDTPTISTPIGDVPLDVIVAILNGENIDSLFSRYSSSLSGVFNNGISGAFNKAADRLNGAFNPASAYLGYAPSKLLSSGVSKDQLYKAGVEIPKDVLDEITEDVESRFGSFVSHAQVIPSLMRDAERRAEDIALTSDSTSADGAIEYGFFTKKGAQQRADAIKQTNKSYTELMTKESGPQQTALKGAATGYSAAARAQAQVSSAAASGYAQVASDASTAQGRPSTQLVLKSIANELASNSKMQADIATAEGNARAQEHQAKAKEVQALQVASKVQIYNAHMLTEIAKALNAQTERDNLTRKAINRIGQAQDEKNKIEAFSQSYVDQGALDSNGLLGESIQGYGFNADPGGN